MEHRAAQSEQSPEAGDHARGPFGSDEELFAAALGRAWRSRYRLAFLRLRRDPSGRWRWNWEAALTPLWLEYRRIPWWPVLYAILLTVGYSLGARIARIIDADETLVALLSITALCVGLQGWAGDWLVYHTVRRRVEKARARTDTLVAAGAMLGKSAPPDGLFSGAMRLFVAIGVVWFGIFTLVSGRNMNRMASDNMMKEQLRAVERAQVAYRKANAAYAPALSELDPVLVANARAIDVTLQMALVDTGFRVTATDAKGKRRCVLDVGIPSEGPYSGMAIALCGAPTPNGLIDR